jgi:hypothetical protein
MLFSDFSSTYRNAIQVRPLSQPQPSWYDLQVLGCPLGDSAYGRFRRANSNRKDFSEFRLAMYEIGLHPPQERKRLAVKCCSHYTLDGIEIPFGTLCLSGAGNTVPYGQACMHCFKAKCKCIKQPSSSSCERLVQNYDLRRVVMCCPVIASLTSFA